MTYGATSSPRPQEHAAKIYAHAATRLMVPSATLPRGSAAVAVLEPTPYSIAYGAPFLPSRPCITASPDSTP